ncbi:MAG: S8 family serine peptidase, partial [Bacteroidota bacterium]
MAAEPTTWQDVYILLKNQVDLKAIEQQFLKEQVSPNERVRRLLLALQDQAQTQDPLRMWLNTQAEATNVEGFWVCNLITARLKPELIEEVAKRTEVAQISWQAPIIGDEYEYNQALAPFSVGGREPGHDAIAAPEMWELGYTGYGRKVLVIDSGVDPSHPALADKYWGNYVPADEAWYHPGGTTSPLACDIHGTHVSGTVVGIDPAMQDTIGVAPGGVWMASPAVGTSNGSTCTAPLASVIGAFQWSLDPDGDPNTIDDMPDVINNSWSTGPTPGSECNSVFVQVFDALELAGIAAVFSAGNRGPGTSTISPPKNIVTSPVNTFCVGMVFGDSPGFPIVNGSSRGPALCGNIGDNVFKPEVVAPGYLIRSSGLNGQYFNLTGTSMATPHVAGALLLLKEAFPDLTGTQLKYALYNSAVDLGNPGEDNVYGQGIINVKAAFDTLVAQGNVPQVISDANDATLVEVNGLAELLCDSIVQPQVIIGNEGNNPISSLWIHWED